MAEQILIFIHGPAAGRRVPVSADELTIGRGKRNDVVLEDPLVSRVHAIVMRRGGVLLVEDLGSHNGTYVNDERVHGPRQIHHQDRLTIGDSRILLEDPALVTEEPTEVAEAPIVSDLTFTQRQLQVLRLLSRGLSNKEIGARLAVTERTVKAYLSSIFEKLEVKNRAGAVTEALRLGLIDLPTDAEKGG